MPAKEEDLLHDNAGIHLEINLVLIGKHRDLLVNGFGRGLIELCCLVKEKGSINKAAQDMGMSYSKAWHILSNAKKILGVSLVKRNRSKGSTITPEAEELIASYYAIQKHLISEAENMVLKMIDRIHECSRSIV